MTTTTNFGITLLEASQAQKEITINQGLTALDAVLMGSVLDKDLATPPGTPAINAMYIVAASPTGAWAGKATSLAYFNQVWNFIVPQNGMRVWVRDEASYYQFNGTSWVISGGGGGGSGDMLKATYDAANISQQVAGTTATQTLTNKTINGASNTLTVRLANDVSGTLPVTNGGNGQTSYTNGQLLIGNSTGNTLAKSTLTAGTGISITNGAGSITITNTGSGGGAVSSLTCNGRLTLTSNVAVTTSDVTAATTLYFTPYRGNSIALYDGTSAWVLLNFSQLSIAVPSTTNTMYDVYAYNNAGAATLELLAWTNDTTRATALVLQDGVYVKTGVTTRRYLGTFRTTATSGQTEDSAAKRMVWNNYNRISRNLRIGESASSWTYSSATARQANGNAANILDIVIGLSEDAFSLASYAVVTTDTTTGISSGFGIDSTTTYTRAVYSSILVSNVLPLITNYYGVLSVGRHTISWLEQGSGSGTQTWYGNANPTGLFGMLWG